jgi:hypothetical protein
MQTYEIRKKGKLNMTNLLKKLVIVFTLALVSIIFTSCDSVGNSFSIIPNKDSISIALGGEIELKSVYKNALGDIIEKVEDDEIKLTFSIQSENNILEVTSGGLVIANKTGTDTVIATLVDGDKTYIDKITISVNIIDVRKIFLNPSVVTFEKDKSSKSLEVIGIDKTGFPTKLYADDMSFIVDTKGIFLLRKDFTDNISRLNIKTTTDRANYTFITPEYTYSGITITGSPTLAQIYPTPQPNKPRKASSGGKDISLVLTYNEKKQRILNITHSDGYKKIYFHKFDPQIGRWYDQTLTLSDSTKEVEALKLVKQDDILYIIVTTKTSIILYASDDDGRNWDFLDIPQDASIKDSSVVKIGDIVYITYINENNNTLNLVTLKGKKYQSTVLAKDINVKSFYVTSNNNNEYRAIIYDGKDLIYVAKQDGKYYKETMTSKQNIEKIKLVFDRKNNPNVIFYEDNFDAKIVIMSKGGVFGGWRQRSISSENFSRAGLKDEYSSSFTLDALFDMDVYFDRKNILRIIVSEDNDVFYIKEYSTGEKSSDFRIDRIATKVGAQSLATVIDNKDRLVVVYKDDSNSWIKFWAEPVLFDYQDQAVKEKIINDDIEKIDSNLLK